MREERFEKYWIAFFTVLLLGVLLGLSVRVGYFHLVKYSRVKREHTWEPLGIRGRILDGSDKQMAVSLPAWRFYADRDGFLRKHEKAGEKERIFSQVAEVLDIPREAVVSAFSTNAEWGRTLAYSYNPGIYTSLMRNSKHISGVRIEEAAERNYSQGCRMAHVIGFLNEKGIDIAGGKKSIGVAGVEQKYESHLKGTDGFRKGVLDGCNKVDTTEREKKRLIDIPPIRGSDVYLTLDCHIQSYVETALKEVVEKVNAAGAWAIVQDVKTGAILAMATYPDFDLNAPGAAEKNVWRNAAVGVVYEPGSVMKTLTLAAALNEGLVGPLSKKDVGYGDFVYANSTLKNNASGEITVARAFKISNNVMFAKLGLELGPKRIEDYLRSFGLGNKLDIDLPGEQEGILGNSKKWDKIKPTRVPIGQGVSVTAIQMINAYSAIANGGKLMRPYVVKRIVSPAGTAVNTEPQEIGEPVSPEVTRVVRELMIDVTEGDGGTGTKARVPGYTVAGKTGTAQCVVKGTYSNTEFVASFVGFLPARAPVFSVLVTVNRPAPGFARTGGAVAAPAFKSIAAATARYLEVPPDLPE